MRPPQFVQALGLAAAVARTPTRHNAGKEGASTPSSDIVLTTPSEWGTASRWRCSSKQVASKSTPGKISGVTLSAIRCWWATGEKIKAVRPNAVTGEKSTPNATDSQHRVDKGYGDGGRAK
jgi:hypothetical protein